MEIDELMKKGEDYMEGMQKGKEMAIGKYDKILIELWDKMNDIEKKVDKNFISLFNTLEIFEKRIEEVRKR